MTTLQAIPREQVQCDNRVFKIEATNFLDTISNNYSSEQIELIRGELTMDDLRVINNTQGMGAEDYYAVARANKLIAEQPDLAEDLDKLKPKDMRHYMRLQAGWVMSEIFLLGTRLKRQPEDFEIRRELGERQEGLRYKVYYCLRFPERVEFPEMG